jgi:hypothetical protein
MVPNDTPEHQPILSKTEARQGVTETTFGTFSAQAWWA